MYTVDCEYPVATSTRVSPSIPYERFRTTTVGFPVASPTAARSGNPIASTLTIKSTCDQSTLDTIRSRVARSTSGSILGIPSEIG